MPTMQKDHSEKFVPLVELAYNYNVHSSMGINMFAGAVFDYQKLIS